MSPRLAFALQTAKLAGDATLPFFHEGVGFELKDDATPVTQADRLAESIVRQEISSRFPNDHVLGEEEGGSEEFPDRWVVDPIDGTKSFVSGVPLYSTLLSYEEDFEPVVAVAYFPALSETVYAEKGHGAFWNGKPCRVREGSDLSLAVVCCGGHKSMESTGRSDGLAKLSQTVMATRTWCDAYGHVLVATGRIDAMLDPRVARWDVSSVSLIVREAGGSFTDFSGRPGLFEEAVSCNPSLLDHILGAFSQ